MAQPRSSHQKTPSRQKKSHVGNGEVSLPSTYEDMVERISTGYDGLSKRLKQIAGYALDHPNDFAIDTIAETAKKADVQPSALIRFAQAFGFDGFSDLQKLFQKRLLEGRPDYRTRLKSVRASGADTPTALLDRFAEAEVAALEHLREEIQPEKLDAAIRILGNAETIHILAMRRAFPLASYFYYAATTLGRRVQLIDNVGGLGEQQLAQMSPKDALLVASFSSYTADVVHAAERAMQDKVPVVALTDHPLSPLTNSSTVCLHVQDAAVHDFRSLGASMCLLQVLMVGLGVKG